MSMSSKSVTAGPGPGPPKCTSRGALPAPRVCTVKCVGCPSSTPARRDTAWGEHRHHGEHTHGPTAPGPKAPSIPAIEHPTAQQPAPQHPEPHKYRTHRPHSTIHLCPTAPTAPIRIAPVSHSTMSLCPTAPIPTALRVKYPQHHLPHSTHLHSTIQLQPHST